MNIEILTIHTLSQNIYRLKNTILKRHIIGYRKGTIITKGAKIAQGDFQMVFASIYM